MDKIFLLDRILNEISDLRKLKRGYLTNFYLDEFKTAVWIKNDVLFYEKMGETVFFIKKSASFWNVFYSSTTLEELQKSLFEFKLKYQDQTLIFDLVGNKEQCELVRDVFYHAGFSYYCCLVRMSRIKSMVDDYNDLEQVTHATEEQAREIHKILNDYFDPKTEQLPFVEEIIEYAKLGHLLVYMKNNEILGFVIFENNKSTLYLRYWFVNPDYRDKKIGSQLLNQYFYEGRKTKRQMFWVIQSNENAIKRYRHYGFLEENMFDYVVTNKTIKYETASH